jgi:chloramphenicol-sensitive protein RarD
MLEHIPAVDLTAHRVIWCAGFVGIILLLRSDLAAVLRALRNDGRLAATLFACGLLLCVNWGAYIWSVESGQLVESSLGYYINPLLSIALGVVLLGEKMSRLRQFAVALAVIAVVVQTIALGRLPWIALAVAFSFAFYGYLRKTAKIEALEGVFAEAALIAPLALAFLLFRHASGATPFMTGDWFTDVLLLMTGPVTALPLTLFSAGVRRIRLSTLGFLQYLAPSLTLLLATFAFGERFTWIHAATFGCVWAALVLLALEGTARRLRPERSAPQRS